MNIQAIHTQMELWYPLIKYSGEMVSVEMSFTAPWTKAHGEISSFCFDGKVNIPPNVEHRFGLCVTQLIFQSYGFTSPRHTFAKTFPSSQGNSNSCETRTRTMYRFTSLSQLKRLEWKSNQAPWPAPKTHKRQRGNCDKYWNSKYGFSPLVNGQVRSWTIVKSSFCGWRGIV